MDPVDRRRAWLWLAFWTVAGVAFALAFPKGADQDSGYHYLKARWTFVHPWTFVDVWARPLFTTLYAIPALAGVMATKFFTLLLCLATAWQTWRLAEALEVRRPSTVIALLFLQPVYFLFCADTMTEPIFALVFVTALRLHHQGRMLAGMFVASLMILARPEGFFLAMLWGAWVLLDRRDPRPWWKRIPSTGLLATGFFAWWAAALLLTGDPLFIKNNWPGIWSATDVTYGRGPIWGFAMRMPEIAGPILLIPFLVGLVRALKDALRFPSGRALKGRALATLTSSFLVIFVVHSLLQTLGRFGSTGFPRYLICVAPATAILALVGWRALEDALRSRLPRVATAAGAAALAVSGLLSVLYADAMPQTRDAGAMAGLKDEFDRKPVPFTRFAWSQAYMCALFDRDPNESPAWSADRKENLARLKELPESTLVYWDRMIGPSWFHLEIEDFEAAGFRRLASRKERLTGKLTGFAKDIPGASIDQELVLLYRDPGVSGPPRK
jgi:hypothetical protein